MKKILALFMLMFAFMVSASVEAKNSTAPADDIKCSCTKECPVNCDCGCKEGKECNCNKEQKCPADCKCGCKEGKECAARKEKNAAAINPKRQIITIKHPNTLNTIKNTALQSNYKMILI